MDGKQISNVVILAGGLATRLQSLQRDLPKCLFRVAGRPFIDYQLQELVRQGIERVVLCLGHLGEQVVDHLQSAAPSQLKIEYSFDGDTLLGTAGAIRKALRLLPEHFFVLYGDSFLRVSYQALADAYFQAKKPAIMSVFKNNGKFGKSNLHFADNRVVSYSKLDCGSELDSIDYGLSILNRQVIEGLPAQESIDLAQLFSELSKNSQLAAFEVTDRFYEIGTPGALFETEEYLRSLASHFK